MNIIIPAPKRAFARQDKNHTNVMAKLKLKSMKSNSKTHNLMYCTESVNVSLSSYIIYQP